MGYYRRTLSVGDLVGKKITDKVWISHRRIRFVGKTVKSRSEAIQSRKNEIFAYNARIRII
jgi:hypothetical protein